jgi:hypothetical protein
MMKKAWLEAILKQPKAVQKKANRIPDPVSARKVSIYWKYCIKLSANNLNIIYSYLTQ